MLDWLRRPLADAARVGNSPQTLELNLEGRRVPLIITRRKTARRMTMRVAHDGDAVRISMPPWGQSRDAVEFAYSRASWLIAQLQKTIPTRPIAPGDMIPFCGQELEIVWSQNALRRVTVTDGVLLCGGTREVLSSRIMRFLRSEAQRIMAEDLRDYCAAIGEPPPPLALSNARRRWGSCSSKGVIRMNWRLIMAPPSVRRSVVAHEAVHLVHFDHSPAFHAKLQSIFEGDLEGANGWLKTHGRSLYGPLG